MNYKHFKNGVLMREIIGGVSITQNLGKTPLELSAQRHVFKPSILPPSLSKQVSNAAKASGRMVKSIFAHERIMVSDEEKERRLSICGECEFYTNGRCAKCGCYINFKTRLETEHCPIKKW